jgi:hypothetical protein
MKKIFLTMAAISALAAAAPAAAQYSRAYADGNVQARVDQVRAELQAGIRSGGISRNEAMNLRQQLQQIRQLEQRYGMNGLSGRERGDLMQRLNQLRQQVRQAERYGERRSRRDGDYEREYDDRYGNRDYDRDYDRNGRIDRDRDGWDDRDRDRDGRWEDDVRDRDYDDRYQRTESRGGIGGLIDRVIGGRNGTELRVGQRVSGNLYGVPSEYRRQFPDGNGVYYRSDGRVIYQIDARTDVVLRVYSMNR